MSIQPVLTALQSDSLGRLGARANIRAGEVIRFAECDIDCCDPDLSVVGAAGIIRADQRRWSVQNLGTTELRVFNLEWRRHLVVIPPAPISDQEHEIPFDLAGIAGAVGHTITVHGPAKRSPQPVTMCSGDLAWSPREGTRLNDAMRALCVAVIEDAPVPTAAQIADSLGTSERAISAAIDTLVEHLPISDDILQRLSRAHAVAEAAIRSGLATNLGGTLSRSG